MTNPLEHIAFEDVNDNYCRAKYGDFYVVMMKKNGYINATKMCHDIGEQTGSKKTLDHWNENKNAKDLANAVHVFTGIPVNKIIIVPKVENALRGTYVHPDLIPHIASWASPKFAVKVARIVNKYFNDTALKEKEKLLQQKDDKIDELLKEVRRQTKHIDVQAEEHRKSSTIMQNKIDKLLRKNKKTNRKLSIIEEQNNGLTIQNAELSTKLEDVLDDRVVKADNTSNQHAFAVIKDSDENNKRQYYVIRTKKKSMKQTIKSYKNVHQNAVELLNIEYNPNSINLWDRIKERLGRTKILCKLNYFGLRQDYTEDQLIKDINMINEDRYAVE